ncbi:hypothetical protein Tco_1429476 [Tanacetum coccineum]
MDSSKSILPLVVCRIIPIDLIVLNYESSSCIDSIHAESPWLLDVLLVRFDSQCLVTVGLELELMYSSPSLSNVSNENQDVKELTDGFRGIVDMVRCTEGTLAGALHCVEKPVSLKTSVRFRLSTKPFCSGVRAVDVSCFIPSFAKYAMKNFIKKFLACVCSNLL